MAKKEVVKVEEASLPATLDLGSAIETYAAENNVRDIESDEIITPRIKLLQSGSPEVKKSSAERIEGAEEGMFCNSSSKTIYSGETGIYIVPCYHERIFNEWTPVDSGGGLVKRWGNDESFKTQGYIEEKGKWQKLGQDEKGKEVVVSEIVKTADYFVLVVNKETGVFYPAVIGFSGTKYKIHRKLANDIDQADYTRKDGKTITPPSFYRVYKLTTVPESDGTNDWFNIKWERAGNIEQLKNGSDVLAAAIEFRKLVLEGKAVAEQESQEFTREATTNDETRI